MHDGGLCCFFPLPSEDQRSTDKYLQHKPIKEACHTSLRQIQNTSYRTAKANLLLWVPIWRGKGVTETLKRAENKACKLLLSGISEWPFSTHCNYCKTSKPALCPSIIRRLLVNFLLERLNIFALVSVITLQHFFVCNFMSDIILYSLGLWWKAWVAAAMNEKLSRPLYGIMVAVPGSQSGGPYPRNWDCCRSLIDISSHFYSGKILLRSNVPPGSELDRPLPWLRLHPRMHDTVVLSDSD